MATLTSEQIAQLAVNNGFSAQDITNLITCVAIAKAESSGRTDAVNNNTNGTADRGVWQINDVHNEKLPGQDRFDPNVNAQLMMMISSGGKNWQPWSTYNNGAYNRFTSEVSNAVMGKTFTPNGPIPLAAGTGSAEQFMGRVGEDVSSITNLFKTLTSRNFWIRFCYVVLGGLLATLGIVALMVATGAAGKVMSVIPSKKLASTAIKAVA